MVMVVNEGFGVFRIMPDPVAKEKRMENQKELENILAQIEADREARRNGKSKVSDKKDRVR